MNYDELIKELYTKPGWDEGIAYINEYIEEHPDNADAYIVRSEMLYSALEDYDDALDDAEKAISLAPKKASAYYTRGYIYAVSGMDISKVIDDFTTAIKLDENHILAYNNRANMYLKQKRFQEAVNDCTKAIDITEKLNEEESIEPYYNRGLALMNLGELDKALADYDKMIEIDPKNAEGYVRRGFLYVESGKTQEAIRDYEMFLRLDPSNKNAGMVRDELKKLKRWQHYILSK